MLLMNNVTASAKLPEEPEFTHTDRHRLENNGNFILGF